MSIKWIASRDDRVREAHMKTPTGLEDESMIKLPVYWITPKCRRAKSITPCDFRKMWLGEYAIRERYAALHNRVLDYYAKTGAGVRSYAQRAEHIALHDWCAARSYTRQEVKRAKLHIENTNND